MSSETAIKIGVSQQYDVLSVGGPHRGLDVRQPRETDLCVLDRVASPAGGIDIRARERDPTISRYLPPLRVPAYHSFGGGFCN